MYHEVMKPETHIPVPSGDGRGARPVYIQHLRKLDVGQSLFFADKEFSADLGQIGVGVRVAARRAWGIGTFVTRTMEDPKRGLGVRVWRTG